MPVKPEDIEKGKCFVTAAGQVRRVTEDFGDKVKFETRGKRNDHWDRPHHIPKDKVQFASEVEKEVRCDL